MFATGTAAEVAVDDEDVCALELGQVEGVGAFELAAIVFKYISTQAVEGDAPEESGRDNSICIDVIPGEGNGGAGDGGYLSHVFMSWGCICLVGEDGFGFDFDQDVGGDEATDFYHCGGGADVAEGFAVGFADEFPFGDVGAVDAGAYYVIEGGSGLMEGGFDIQDDLFGLGVYVADAY